MKKNLLILSSHKHPNEKTIYDVENKDNVITLYYSAIDRTWTNPGKPAYSLYSNGNGFVFKDLKDGQVFHIDYCQAEALRALFKLEDTVGATFEYLERK